MNMITCVNGHYYNSAENEACPYCGENMYTQPTIANNGLTENRKNTIYETSQTKIFPDDSTSETKTITPNIAESTELLNGDFNSNDTESTVYIPKNRNTVEKGNNEEDDDSSIVGKLLAGWLVIVSDQGKGEFFPLAFGMNTLGRDQKNHVCIENGDNSISREKHAQIIYDYQNNIFFVKHGEGQYLSYLNDEVLLEAKQFKANDRLRVGSTDLIFIPLCSDKFTWEE